MPWENNEALLKSIPSLKALPNAAQTMFRSVANKQISKGDSEATSAKIAWGVVKKKFEQRGDKWIARSDAFRDVQYYEFVAEPAEKFISRSEAGVELHNYVLTDIWPDAFGTSPTEELMIQWAEWINQENPEIDVNHELYDKARMEYKGNIDMVKRALRAKRGIAKAVQAVVDKGKLIVSLAFDKRYKNYLDDIKGLSIEAAAVEDKLSRKWVKGDLLGFTFMVNQSAGNPRAKRL